MDYRKRVLGLLWNDIFASKEGLIWCISRIDETCFDLEDKSRQFLLLICGKQDNQFFSYLPA